MVVSRCGGVGRHWRLYASWLVGGGEEGGERYFFCGDVWELFFWHACFVSRWWAAGLVRCSSIVSILGASAVCLASSSPSLPFFFCSCLCRLCSSALFLCAVYAVFPTWRSELLRTWMDSYVVPTHVVPCVDGCALSCRDARAASGIPRCRFSDALLVWAAVAATRGGGRRGIKRKRICGHAWSTVSTTAAVTHD